MIPERLVVKTASLSQVLQQTLSATLVAVVSSIAKGARRAMFMGIVQVCDDFVAEVATKNAPRLVRGDVCFVVY